MQDKFKCMDITLEKFTQLIDETIDMICGLEQFYKLRKPTPENISNQTLEKINHHVKFWNNFELCSFIGIHISIRKLFDNGKDTQNFNEFINYCRKNINLFNVDEVLKRGYSKININFINPTEQYFEKLKILIKPHQKIIHKIIDCTNEAFAHALYEHHTHINKILEKHLSNLTYTELKIILFKVKYCNKCIRDMYYIGCDNNFLDYVDNFEKEIELHKDYRKPVSESLEKIIINTTLL